MAAISIDRESFYKSPLAISVICSVAKGFLPFVFYVRESRFKIAEHKVQISKPPRKLNYMWSCIYVCIVVIVLQARDKNYITFQYKEAIVIVNHFFVSRLK